jgi:hypothetical protein
MLEIIIMIGGLVTINTATVAVTVYKLAKKYNRPWQVILKRLDIRVKPGYGSTVKEK